MAFAIVCLAVRLAPAQEFVRIVPNRAGITDAGRREVYTDEELGGGSPPAAPADGASGTLSPEETDRLVDQYRREAGTLGPSRWFSASKLGFHFGVGEAYDSNIRTSIGGTGNDGDEITTITGGVDVSLGDYLERQGTFIIFDYTLTENVFANHGDEDALDQDGLFDAMYRRERFSGEFVSRFQSLHDPTSDTAERERRYLYGEELNFQYRYGDKTTLAARFDYDRIDAAEGDSNHQYAAELSADYQVFDKVKLGVGVAVGRLDADGGLEETYEQLLARLEYQLTGKVSLVSQVGVDIRERGSYAGDAVTPVFSLQGRWTPYDGTTLTLGGTRHVNASESIAGEDFTESTVQFDLRQRFYRRFFLLGGAGYTHSDYENVTRIAFQPARTDDYYFVRLGADYEAAKYVDVGLFYQRTQNDSTQSSYSYASNRVYLQSHFVY